MFKKTGGDKKVQYFCCRVPCVPLGTLGKTSDLVIPKPASLASRAQQLPIRADYQSGQLTTKNCVTVCELVEKQACCAGCRRRPFTAEAPLIGKIHPFIQITITFEPVMRFGCPLGFRIS